MDWLKDLHVLVLGLGDSGLAMARWCAHNGAVVTVWDSRDQPPHGQTLARELPAVALAGGALAADQLAGQQLVLKSPGLAPTDPRVAALLQHARATGIAVLGELDLFARALADLRALQAYAPQVLAVSGTNGKTTTTAMTALLVARTGKRVATAGNIGPTLLGTLTAELSGGRDTLPEVWVLELSSFQLDQVRGFAPSAATVLNISQDHLDWHGDMAAYTAAKARVFGTAADGAVASAVDHAVKDGATNGATTSATTTAPQAATMVINRDDPAVTAMVPAPSPVKGKQRPPDRQVVTFGLDAPRRPGDFGLVVENGMAWLVRALPSDDTIRRRKGEPEDIHLQHLMPADALRVRGRHNAANALAALALATAIGCPLAPMLHGLRDYAGEPHRVQPVALMGGVEAYDDSKGTNVGATVAALNGLGADKAPGKLVVILGGDGKGQDFMPLAAPLLQHARAVATIGRDAAAVEAAVLAGTHGLPLQRHATLEDAVAWCFARAQPGDAVLLSPACASLDMYRNYAHRAQVFVDAVQAVAQEQGALV